MIWSIGTWRISSHSSKSGEACGLSERIREVFGRAISRTSVPRAQLPVPKLTKQGDLDAGTLVLPGFEGFCFTPCGSIGDPRFGLKAQTIGDPIGVRIVADNLNYVEDVTIREAGGS